MKVTDFGLSALRERPPDERFQSVLSYAAPERLSGGPATTASDMYSLGVLFVACLSGIAAAGTSGSPPVTNPAADPVTPDLAALWAACLGASPRDRPSAAHVAFMSRQALAAQPAAARAEGEPVQASTAEPRTGNDGPGQAREGAATSAPARCRWAGGCRTAHPAARAPTAAPRNGLAAGAAPAVVSTAGPAPEPAAPPGTASAWWGVGGRGCSPSARRRRPGSPWLP